MATSQVTPDNVPPTDAEILTFEKIVELMSSFKKTHVFLAAVKLGVFTAAHGSRKTADEIGQACNVHDTKTLDALLDILVTEKLLNRYGGDDVTTAPVYENSSGAGLLLGDASAPTHMGAIGLLMDDVDMMMKVWMKFSDCVSAHVKGERTEAKVCADTKDGDAGKGETKGEAETHSVIDNKPDEQGHREASEAAGEAAKESDETEWKEEWAGQYDICEAFMRVGFHMLAEKFDFSRFKHVLDIGGGRAQLSRLLCRRFKDLRCTSMDLPCVLGGARKAMEGTDAEVADRITLIGGDCLKDDIPQPVDVIILSNLLCALESNAACQQLLKKVYGALSSGGVLIALEDMLNEARDSSNTALPWLLDFEPLLQPGATAAAGSGNSDVAASQKVGIMRKAILSDWCRSAGFAVDNGAIYLAGNVQALVATKK